MMMLAKLLITRRAEHETHREQVRVYALLWSLDETGIQMVVLRLNS